MLRFMALVASTPVKLLRWMPAHLAGLALLLACLAGQLPAAETPASSPVPGKRLALVIGNGAYGELGTLPNPPNDASDIADALKGLDFDVSLVVDGNVDTMRTALRDFARSATDADVALFYYAGHGMALGGENYLVPVGAHIQSELDLRYETLGLSDVRDALDFTDAKLKMVFLDACRDNPLAKLLQLNEAQLGRGLTPSNGLAPMDVERASGMFIAYATAPGNVALDGSNQRNSPFTKALLAHIATPNTDVRVMFGDVRADVVKATDSKQTPWTEEAMLGEFQFKPVAVAPTPVLPPAYLAWEAIATSEDPADIEAFLQKFPDGTMASVARDRLELLTDPARELAAWNELQGSSDASAYETFLHRYPNGVYSTPAEVTLQGLLWAQLAASQDIAGMQAFVSRFPNAPLAPVARTTIAQLKAAPAKVEPTPAPVAKSPDIVVALAPPREAVVAAPAPEPATTDSPDRALALVNPPEALGTGFGLAGVPTEADLSPDSVARLRNEISDYLIQIALSAKGYYHGKLDGKFGPGSRSAVAAFQRDIGASATGNLRPVEIVALVSSAATSGDADCQNSYGGMFETGAGVTMDPAAAARWYRQSAEADNGYAQLNLGRLYMQGLGVERDPDEAKRWFEAAASNNVPEAQTQLDALR